MVILEITYQLSYRSIGIESTIPLNGYKYRCGVYRRSHF